jgi:hypothetical protein
VAASARRAGLWWIAAAGLFWLAWLLMPGVGITDADRILTLVAQQRAAVRLSAALQLVSAACYAPALVGLVASPRFGSRTGVRVGASLLLVGAMGSAADAVFHLLADAMLTPGLDRPTLVTVMQQMQGPGLRFILPLIAAYFAGAACLSVALWRARLVPRWNALLHLAAIGVAVAGGVLLAGRPAALRAVGLTVLFLIAAAQAWLGARRLAGAAAADPGAPREATTPRGR